MLYDDEDNETASQITENIEGCHNFVRLMEVYDDGEDDQQRNDDKEDDEKKDWRMNKMTKR